MYLTKLRIRNFRCFSDQEITFSDYSCFVGANGSGKSTVLMALNVFFRNINAPSDVTKLQEEDFHLKNISKPIEITCTFAELSDEAKSDLKAYVRQDELVITATAEWNPAISCGEVRQIGIRNVMAEFSPYFQAEENGTKAADLKDIYKNLSKNHLDLPNVTTKDAMRNALREYEEAHPELCEEVQSNNQFYGWSKGVNLLQVIANMDQEQRTNLLLGFEEPELYQHPPQAKHLAGLLEKLSTQYNQVIITTHSPYFVSSKGYEDIRLVNAPLGQHSSVVNQLTYENLCHHLATALQEEPQRPTELMAAVEQIMQPSQNELFFCKTPIFVEGTEDIAFITTYMRYNKIWDEFRKLGGHFIVCNGKTNMSRPIAIAQGLGLKPFVIFDGDCNKANKENPKDQQIRDNQCILKLLGSKADPIARENIIDNNYVRWDTCIFEEISNEIGKDKWEIAEAEAREKFKLQSGVRRKNPVLITATVEIILSNKQDIKLLRALSDKLISHCQSLVEQNSA